MVHAPRVAALLLLLTAGGCASLPDTRFLTERYETQAAKIENARGPLSAQRSAAIIAEGLRKTFRLRRRVGELLSPIVLVVAAQHVAANVARRHGRDPEKPAGLSKVTRTL